MSPDEQPGGSLYIQGLVWGCVRGDVVLFYVWPGPVWSDGVRACHLVDDFPFSLAMKQGCREDKKERRAFSSSRKRMQIESQTLAEGGCPAVGQYGD